MKHSDFDRYIKSLTSVEPSPEMVGRWKAAVRSERRRLSLRDLPRPRWIQVAAAGLIGFIIGGVAFRKPEVRVPEKQEISWENATQERVFVKTD